MSRKDVHSPLILRLRDGLDRVATVLKKDQWVASAKAGLNPTQLLALGILLARPQGLRVSELAGHLGVSQPTVTDTIVTLEAKGLVLRKADASDARARNVALTPQGRAAVRMAATVSSGAEVALQSLSQRSQTDLLVVLTHLIRQFQLNGTLPGQRICGTCKYFQPFKYHDAARPHHCAFVNASFGTSDLQTDCRDHETASPADQTAIWSDFEKGQAVLQAKPKH